MAKAIILLLLFCNTSVSGQHKPIEIRDIKLKLTTINFIDSLAKEKSFIKKTVNCDEEFNFYNKSGKCIMELLPNTSRYCILPYTHPCKATRVFYIPGINLSDIAITGFALVFYKDSLASMRFDYTEALLNEFRSIYGSDGIDTVRLNGAIERSKVWTDSLTHDKIFLIDLRRLYPDTTSVFESIMIDIDRLTMLISACDLEEYRKQSP